MRILIGDGKHDDTNAIQDFMDGKTIWFEGNELQPEGLRGTLEELPKREFLITRPIQT